MNTWRIDFGNGLVKYLKAMTLLDVVKLIPQQNWDVDINFVVSAEIVESEPEL